MPIQLDKVISTDDPGYKAFQQHLQGNILKSHGRDYSRLLLLEFKPMLGLRRKVGTLARTWCTSAAKQDEQTVAYKEHTRKEMSRPPTERQPDQQVFGALMLSVWGYRHLGYTPEELGKKFPEVYDPTFSTNWFLNGMEHHGAQMCDPPPMKWDQEYADNQVDAILLLACDDEEVLKRAAQEASCEAGKIANVFCIERGQTLRDESDRERSFDNTGEPEPPIEMFGFRDGVSQPTLLGKNGDKEQIPAKTILVPDALAEDPDAFGTYVVYRKLEQNVAGFRKAEAQLAENLCLEKDDRERAGAMIVGRFRNGTPLVTEKASVAVTRQTDLNGFDFAGDVTGSRCPFHAHIRKVRPDRNGDNSRRILRRGMVYGDYNPNQDAGNPPEKGVGMLFLAYMANIQHQFGFIQTQWVNKFDFPRGSRTGPDPLIGQGTGEPIHQWQTTYGGANERKKCSFARFVTLKGGEFLFLPSMRYFQLLEEDNTGH